MMTGPSLEIREIPVLISYPLYAKGFWLRKLRCQKARQNSSTHMTGDTPDMKYELSMKPSGSDLKRQKATSYGLSIFRPHS